MICSSPPSFIFLIFFFFVFSFFPRLMRSIGSVQITAGEGVLVMYTRYEEVCICTCITPELRTHPAHMWRDCEYLHLAFYLVRAYEVSNERRINSEENRLSPVVTAGTGVSSRQCGRHVQRLSNPALQKPLSAPGPCINQQMISGRWPTPPTGLYCRSSSSHASPPPLSAPHLPLHLALAPPPLPVPAPAPVPVPMPVALCLCLRELLLLLLLPLFLNADSMPRAIEAHVHERY